MKLSSDGTVLEKVDNNDIDSDGSYDIPSGVTSIHERAFEDCSHLKELSIPASIVFIGNGAFSGCSGLQTLTILAKVIFIGDSVFYGCTGLQSISIPQGVTSIADWAFSGCRNLKTIFIPDEVTAIGSEAFSRCTSVQSFSIPSKVISIGAMAFLGCSSMKTFTMPFGVTIISDRTFSGCTKMHTFSFAEGVTSIGHSAFFRCSSMRAFTIPESVTFIGNVAFSECSSLEALKIPKGVTSLGSRVFSGCSNLQMLSISTGITSVGKDAFKGCSSLHVIAISGTNAAEIQRVINLLPAELRAKATTQELVEEAFQFINEQLFNLLQSPEINALYPFLSFEAPYVSTARVIDETGDCIEVQCDKLPNEVFLHVNSFIAKDIIYYQQAQMLMRRVPVPKNEEEMSVYKNNLIGIVSHVIKKARKLMFLRFYFELKFQELANQGNALRLDEQIEAADVMSRLHQKMKTSYNAHFSSNVDQFEQESHEAIQEAHLQLGRHYVTEAYFSFFHKDIANKVNALKSLEDGKSEAQQYQRRGSMN